MEPKNVIYEVKRWIGRKYSEVKSELAKMPYETKEGSDGGVIIVVDGKEYKPEQISAFVLTKLKEDAEKTLYKAMSDISAATEASYNEGNYAEALSTLSSLKEPVDNFFDKVMVNCEDAAVKNNRLALLRQLRNMFTHIADISLIQK